MNSCRGCGGTGIDASVPPRAAQAACLEIVMRGTTRNVVRIEVAGRLDRGRMRFTGPLTSVIEHVEQREHAGYQIVQGEKPDPALACQWCNGYGSPDGQLTVRALEKLSEA